VQRDHGDRNPAAVPGMGHRRRRLGRVLDALRRQQGVAFRVRKGSCSLLTLGQQRTRRVGSIHHIACLLSLTGLGQAAKRRRISADLGGLDGIRKGCEEALIEARRAFIPAR
jgi:hypothetical protein